jgi:hypothetical protein
MKPAVSIVTPTIPGREDLLWDRCTPSVQEQQWEGRIQHVIVSDRNPDLYNFARGRTGNGWRQIQVVQLNESWRTPENMASPGAVPWAVGSLLALGDFVGFLGDDDELLPDHVQRHVGALQEHDADFSIGQVEFRAGGVPQFVVGNASMAHGNLDADGIMCRASALKVATWSVGSISDGFVQACDWRLVRDWLAGGLKGVFIGEGPTAIHHDGWVVGKTGKP